MSGRRGVVPGLLSGLVLAVLAPGVAASADDTNQVGLSRDGKTWSSSLGRPLFDPDTRWVPGDVRTATFYLRNEATSTGDASLEVSRLRGLRLVDAGDLRVKARVGQGPWSDVVEGSRQELLSREDLARGGAIPISVKAHLPFGSVFNGSMRLTSDLDFRVVLSDARARTGRDGRGGRDGDVREGPDGSDDTSRSGDGADGTDGTDTSDPTPAGRDLDGLPDTGAVLPAWLVPLGLALCLLGSVVLTARRRIRPTSTSSSPFLQEHTS